MTVAIRFIDDPEIMFIDNVKEYGYRDAADRIYYVEKNNKRMFFNMDEVLYICDANLI